jgi:hypothetical protein
MKNKIRSIIALAFAAALVPFARAESHQVSGLTTAAVSTIIIPGAGPGKILWVTISNTGSNQVNITADGGTANNLNGTDPTTGATGNGIPIAAGTTVFFYGPNIMGVPIRAIMASGTTTLNICTNAQVGTSSFPTN